MNLQTLISTMLPGRQARLAKEARAHQRSRQRSYLAGKLNRLNRDWPANSLSARSETNRSLRIIRARMRYLARNSDHFKKFLSMVRNNVAGPFGMTLQITAGSETQNKQITAAFQSWAHMQTASLNGRLSWTMILRRLCTILARDGEVLVREIYGKNRFGYALKFYDVSWLDETYNERRPVTGNRVIMSVEIDSDDRPVAYWLTPPPDEYAFGLQPPIRQRTRVPAEEMHHLFLPDDENCGDDTNTRGMPWAHTASLSMFNLDRADEANMYSMRAGASKMGFFKPPETDDEPGEGDNLEESQRAPLIDHFEPGTFWEMPPGYEFTPFDPQFPNQTHDPFAKYMLHRIAAGLDVSYHSLAGDLTQVNFSSIRVGLLDEREVWKSLQEFLVESFCRPVFNNWLKSAVLAGLVQLRPREAALFSEPKFQPRRWPWVDPLKDIQAERMGIEAGLDTITDSLAEQGKDLRETFTKRKAELDLAKELGVPLTAGAGSLAPGTLDAQGDEQPAPTPTPEPAPAKPTTPAKSNKKD
jgi:lambda family phage portal protein